MKPAPEPFFIQLAEERQLESATTPPHDPELAADWRLRRELQQLDAPTLPDEFRHRLARQTGWRHRPPWWLGLAATVLLALGLGLFLLPNPHDSETHTISDSDLKQLHLALTTLNQSARRTGTVAGRELGISLTRPSLELTRLPYADTLHQWIQPQEPLKPET